MAGAPKQVNHRNSTRQVQLSHSEWRQVAAMATTILLISGLGWGVFVFGVLPLHFKAIGIGLAVTAYTLGMRHAFDADHIAAIDNTTRKLMSEGKRPLTVGYFFSLGHSLTVFVLGLGVTFASRAVFGAIRDPHSALQTFGGLIGTSISGLFLYLIATLNAVILVGVVRLFLEMRQGRFSDEQLETQLQSRGLMFRFFGRLMRSIRHPWQMAPVGMLFGLGFDTVTEVALFGTVAGAATQGLPWYGVLSLPALFSAGMTLLDTLDGSFMNYAYGWAFARPIRKVYYNIAITGLSVTAALVIGTIELVGVLANELHLNGPFWDSMSAFNVNAAGFILAALFAAAWIAALLIWRFAHIETRWERAAEASRQRRVIETELAGLPAEATLDAS